MTTGLADAAAAGPAAAWPGRRPHRHADAVRSAAWRFVVVQQAAG